MNKNILEQSHFFEKRIFEIEEKGVRQVVRGIFKYESALIPFENITLDHYEYKRIFRPPLTITIFFFIFFLIGLFSENAFKDREAMTSSLVCLLIATISSVWFFMAQKIYVIYGVQNNLRLILLKNKPNNKFFNSFVNQMQESKKSYLRLRYLTLPFNPNNSSDIQRLRWLKSMGAILEEEIEKLSLNDPQDNL